MNFAVGTLVRARGREWVVLPESDDEMYVLRPLGGTEDEIAGVVRGLEPVEAASFALPTVADLGDHRSAQLLRDALRLGFRNSAGPFRSFGGLNFEPRPYQLVPLMMALRLDPVRLLIADDVGTGKTASTLMIAAELLAQGQVQRMTVLCPPHLAVQWQNEMKDKFHLDAELVLPSTASRLERGCRTGETLFERHDITIVSTEFIKADRRRAEFLRTAPELVIVDEAHTCAFDSATRSGRHIRHDLVSGLAADTSRHLLLVTATPHSGNERAFRSLLAMLDPEFAELPDDLSGEHNRRTRERLARHMVQRRRADLRRYLEAETPFPDRKEVEATYRLSGPYQELFDAALAFARETVTDASGGRHRQRMRWWSALALLRALASSPAAAADTLANRARSADTATAEEADDVGRRVVLDTSDEDAEDYLDHTGGSDADEPTEQTSTRRQLQRLRRLAEAITPGDDAKLAGLVTIVRQLLDEGFRPIVFCRYIRTAEYVAKALAKELKNTGIQSVTGADPSTERPAIVERLAEHERRVLVATDCLSEGINLQSLFDAVVHYDLSWNPTRHEQREGRVDRFGQPRGEVRVVTYYGSDNRVDGLVLDVLLRKHKTIRTSLGYSVPVPGDTNTVVEAILEGLLLRDDSRGTQLRLEGLDPAAQLVLDRWESAAEREKRSRTVFAQETIRPDEVAAELDEVRTALGTVADVELFVRGALTASRAHVSGSDPMSIDLSDVGPALRDALGSQGTSLAVRFGPPSRDGEMVLTRTHPLVAGLASFVLETSLDHQRAGLAARAGVARTHAVTTRTALLLVRYRFDLHLTVGGSARQLLAEDVAVLGFTGTPDQASWLDAAEAESLLSAPATGNISREQAEATLRPFVDATGQLLPVLDAFATTAAERLRGSHQRVRQSVRVSTHGDRVEARTPVDVLGLYVLLPVPKVA